MSYIILPLVGSITSVSDSNSVDLTLTSGVLSADVRISSNAADATYLKIENAIQSATSLGLRSQIQKASASQGGYLASADFSTFSGKVSGPGSSTDTGIARFSGTGGATIQNSGVTIDASDNLATTARINAGTAKVGATGAATASTTLEVAGTTGAFLLPRLTTTQRNALTGAAGMVIYNTTAATVQCYIGGATSNWVDMLGWGAAVG